jgi:hypothetical protein
LLVNWLGELIDVVEEPTTSLLLLCGIDRLDEVVEEPTTSLPAGPPPLERADNLVVEWMALLVDWIVAGSVFCGFLQQKGGTACVCGTPLCFFFSPDS